MKVSIFDRFVSRETGEPERKSFHPTPYRKMFSELDAAGKEVKAQYPEDCKIIDDFIWALKALCKARYKKALDGDMQPMRAEAQFYLSPDRMCAYACLIPPEYGGEEISLESFLGDMHYEGILFGVLREDIPEAFAQGYLRPFPVARGTPPLAGEDGSVRELFQRRRHMRLEVQSGSEVDFSQDFQLQPIRKGTVICLIQPPRPGTDGMDVTGQTLPCPAAEGALIPQGENTAVDREGQALTASVDGLLYMENDRFCIHEQRIIDGDLDQFHEPLCISGSLYVGGNVDGGVEVEATGDIVINGKIGQARVRSTGGTLRVQQGVYGTDGKTVLAAACQIQSPVVERAEIQAGTSVIAETISNSTIRCGGTVYVMSGRGMIVDSLIWAGDSILCQRVGNLAGGRSRFSVGYPPHIPESWERIKSELAKAQATLEKLWEPITSLRKKGTRISDREKALLEQLVEQRELYTERREALTQELRTVNAALDKKSRGKIRCEKLYPFLNVQIGRLTEEITTMEECCSIHVDEGGILLK